MLSDKEIVPLFHDMEADRVERKREYHKSADKIRQAICAFANDLPNRRKPGVIFVGQEDDGRCSGLTIDDELLRTLGGFRSDGQILPFPIMSVARHVIDGCAVAVIVVEPSSQPPVRFDGRCWIRIGPRRGLATPEEERRLSEKQVWQNLTFDARPCLDASLADLDLLRFETEYVPSATSPEIRRQNGRSTEEKLRALRLLSKDGKPTNAAILLFGKESRSYFPGSYIQFLRINGSALTDPIIDQKEISGPVPDQIRQIEEVLRINIQTGVIIGGLKRQEKSAYPMEALEQLTRNAVLHRNYENSTMPIKIHWYNDRIEIINSGGLYGEVTPENIWHNVTAYRNPLLAEGLKTLGFVERFGYGLLRARQLLKENGNPDLKNDFLDQYVLFKVELAS